MASGLLGLSRAGRTPALLSLVVLATALPACSDAAGEAEAAALEACDERQRAAIVSGHADSGLGPAPALAIGALETDGAAPLVVCTATLVRESWLLTARHCLGARLNFVAGRGSAAPRAVVAEHEHPELDAALLELAGEDRGAAPLALYTGPGDACLVGRSATLAGVGTTADGTAGQLLFVDEVIRDVTRDELIVDGEGRSGACAGDSGGPLLLADAAGAPQVAGVLRAGSASCRGRDAYVRIDRLAGWLGALLGG